MHFATLVVVPLGLAAYVAADCCSADMVNPIGMYDPANPPPTIVCDDLSDPTPCCGVGECNIFCCDCDGGCRQDTSAKNRKRDNSTGEESVPTDSLFQSVDGDTDQYLSLAEYIGWVESTKGEAVVKNATFLDLWIQKFESHDTNGDGMIEPGEMEPST